jgi:MFS family permease
VPLVLALPSGQLADRFGERVVMIAGGTLTLVSALAFSLLGGTVQGLLLASVLLGTGHLGSVVAQQALVANRTARRDYDKAFGRYTFAASTGQAVGPGLIVLFGGAATIPDTKAIFWWTVALSVFLLASAVLLPRSGTDHVAGHGTRGGVRELLRRPGLVRALSISCIVLAAVDISLVYLPVLGTEAGISAGVVGTLLALRAAASMVSRFFLGQLSSAVGRGRLLTGSIALSALTMALVPAPVHVLVLGVVVIGLGLGLGVGQPLTMSWLAEQTPPGLRGRAMSLRLTGNRLGQVLVPTAAGVVAAGAGAAGVLLATSGALAAAAVASRGVRQPGEAK